MGFETRVQKRILLEWKNHYISYPTLKLLFNPFKTTAKLLLSFSQSHSHNEHLSISSEDKAQLQSFYQRFREIFASEIKKINDFLEFQVKICETEWVVLKSRILNLPSEDQSEQLRLQPIFHQFYLKLGYITEYYRTNELIKSHIELKFKLLFLIFQDFIQFSLKKPLLNPLASINHSVFPKLLKKPLRTLHLLLDKSRFLYLNVYFSRFRRNVGEKRLKELFRQSQSKLIPPYTMYTLYLFSGIAFILTIMIILLIYNQGLDPDTEDSAKQTFKYQFPIFRGFLMIILYMILLALNVYGWLRNHLNYRAVFGFETHYSSTSEIMSRAMFFSAVWLLTFLIFLVFRSYFGANSKVLGFLPIHYLGGLNWLLFLIYMFFPNGKYFNGQGRAYFFKIIWKVIWRSCWRVEFPMLFVLNQFTSFVTALKDLEYTFCFYISIWLHPESSNPKFCMDDSLNIGFLVSFMPLMWRIIQCIRTAYDRQDPTMKKLDVVNIFKFITSATTTILSLVVGKLKSKASPFKDQVFDAWIAVASISTVYSYVWDIKMGWMLCQKGYGLLRKDLYYSKWVYYVAIVLNLIFRITWILNISPDVINTVFWRPELSSFVLGFMEMIRRTIWNFLRVDKETAQNKKGFGFIQDIIINMNEMDARNTLERGKTIKISLDSHSTFSMDDLVKRGHISSLEDLTNLNKGIAKSSDEIDEQWELVEDRVKKDTKVGKEELEEMRKEIYRFERQMKEKSRNNTLIGVDPFKGGNH